MQPNVQSPQVPTSQTSIVQSQQTTLPANEQTETQTSNQEPFAVSVTNISYVIHFTKRCMLLGKCFLVTGIVIGVFFFIKCWFQVWYIYYLVDLILLNKLMR